MKKFLKSRQLTSSKTVLGHRCFAFLRTIEAMPCHALLPFHSLSCAIEPQLWQLPCCDERMLPTLWNRFSGKAWAHRACNSDSKPIIPPEITMDCSIHNRPLFSFFLVLLKIISRFLKRDWKPITRACVLSALPVIHSLPWEPLPPSLGIWKIHVSSIAISAIRVMRNNNCTNCFFVLIRTKFAGHTID